MRFRFLVELPGTVDLLAVLTAALACFNGGGGIENKQQAKGYMGCKRRLIVRNGSIVFPISVDNRAERFLLYGRLLKVKLNCRTSYKLGAVGELKNERRGGILRPYSSVQRPVPMVSTPRQRLGI